MKQAISYLRVSSENQGKSGLGLAGQRVQIEEFARAEGYAISDNDWFSDVASGKTFSSSSRPGLIQAMRTAAARRCPIIISSFSRLSRNTAAFEKIMRHPKLMIIAADVGEGAGYAVIEAKARRAEAEGQEISRRTREGLRRAKERGVRLGNPQIEDARTLAIASNRAKANERNRRLQQTLKELGEAGFSTAPKIAEELNRLGVHTARGTFWTETNVRRLQKQIAQLDAEEPREQVGAELDVQPTRDGIPESYADDPLYGMFS